MNNRFSQSVIVIGVASLLTAGAAMAAPGGRGEGPGPYGPGGPGMQGPGDPVQMVARLNRRLDLTAEQEDAILAFLREREAEREVMQERIREAFGDEVCAQRAAGRAAFDDLMYDVLDEDQLEAHQEMKANMEERRANGKGRGRRGADPFGCDDS